MVDINWGLLQPVDIGANFQSGFAMGQQVVEKHKLKSALAAYAQNPNDPAAVGALSDASPQFAMQQAEQRLGEQRTLRERERVGAYFSNPDLAAARQQALQGGEIDVAEQIGKMDDAQKAKVVSFHKAAAPYAYQLSQMPPGPERAAYFEQVKPLLASEGADAATLNSFDPNNDAQLKAFIAQGQTVEQMVNSGKIEWHQQGESPSFATDAQGHPVGTQNPYAQGGAVHPATPHVTDAASYAAVPPGGHYTDDHGNVRTKPGGQARAPGNFP